MTWPTRDDYILRGAAVPSRAGGSLNPDLPPVEDGGPLHCPECMDEGYEYDHVPDACPRSTLCCGARLDPDLEGFCPQCGEHC